LLVRLLPLLIVPLCVGCLVGASGEREPPNPTAGASGTTSEAEGAGQATPWLLLISTVTPAADEAASRLAAAPSPSPEVTPTATVTATETVVPTETAFIAVATDTPEPLPTETPLPPTETPTETPTLVPTETATPTASPTATPSPTPVTPTVVPISGMSVAETQILVGHNKARDQNGLPRLQTNSTLMSIARQRAQNMASTGVLSHTNPDGSNVFGMMNAAGYAYTTGGENIHYNFGYSEQQSPEVAMDEWMNSPPHRATILSPNHVRIGIGVVTASDGTVYYSVVFSD
jgi:uncharacterized protein YkwD